MDTKASVRGAADLGWRRLGYYGVIAAGARRSAGGIGS
jgi:hypothetical protein